MFEHRARLGVPVMAGVGAAFDFLAGTARQAPAWMQENGLEWLFRLTQEPKRLWRRYQGLGSKFAWNVALELLGVKKFERVIGAGWKVTEDRGQQEKQGAGYRGHHAALWLFT